MVGVIYDPHRKELFYAVRGYGAYVGTVVFDDNDENDHDHDNNDGGGSRSVEDVVGVGANDKYDKADDDEFVHLVTDGDDGPRLCTTTTTTTTSSSPRIHITNARRISPPPFPPSTTTTTSTSTAASRSTSASASGNHHHRRGPSTLSESLVAMGSPPGEESLAMSLRALPALMPKVRSIRMIGSAAIMLAWVADGRLSAYWEYDLR